MPPVIENRLCNMCKLCFKYCPGDVFTVVNDEMKVYYPDECSHCGACYLDCPEGAIKIHIPLTIMLTTSGKLE
ncbi:ferredoxin family protein [Chloroflexota bacterium]